MERKEGLPVRNPGFDYRFRDPIHSPQERGVGAPMYRHSEESGMIVERDVPVMMRDGARLYVDVFRPQDDRVPPLIAWSPYGKHESTSALLARNYPNSGVGEGQVSANAAFEAPDPDVWIPLGYAVINVNTRGTWHSEGNATFVSPEEAEDFYDLIEWAGVQPWSNGKVGLSGVSYLTVMQWRVAQLQPPHLAAINPWEGWSDTYREVARHGGIPDSSFWPYLHERWGYSSTRVEDLAAETAEHPLYDAFWASKAADLAKVTVPAYVVASWTDQGLHTRGTLEGFKRIRSRDKWLEVHGQKKWAYYYDPESVRRQHAFFDQFLKSKRTGLGDWPRVRVEVRDRIGVATVQAEHEWPIARTAYTKLYLDATTGQMQREPVDTHATANYDANAQATWTANANPAAAYESAPAPTSATSAKFTHTFDAATDLVGHIKLKVYMATSEADDMDVFVAVNKLDAGGEVVPFAYYAQLENGPVALGWLRASHRELDEAQSTEFQPVLTHRHEQKLQPGEVVPLEIEVWPSGTHFATGESLQITIAGHDLTRYGDEVIIARHEDSVNRGAHVMHTGGAYPSHLLVPVVPQR